MVFREKQCSRRDHGIWNKRGFITPPTHTHTHTNMNRLKNYIPAIAVTILILLLSLISPEKLPNISTLHFTGMDKVIHMIMYAVLSIAWVFALPVRTHTNIRWMLTLALLISLFGLLMEICQSLFTVSRSMDMLDAVANLAGALVAVITIYSLKKYKAVVVAKPEQ